MSKELESFCEELFGSHEGYVYAPVKNPKKAATEPGHWKQHFFKWPSEKQELYDHILRLTGDYDVYIGPSLYSTKSSKTPAFMGSQYVWAEFDGILPKRLGDVPPPSIKIRSSEVGHEHWYWRLETFETSPEVIANITKKIAYTLHADLSGWDPTQVLRPPATTHHDSGKTVSRLVSNDNVYSVTDFASIEEPILPAIHEVKVADLPDLEAVIATYKWEPDSFDLFRKPELPVGQRSSGLTRLAFDCVEMGMSNEETLSILHNADMRWKKYSTRTDRLKRLIGIIQHVRSQKSKDEILTLTDKPILYRYEDFMDTTIELDWIVDGVLPVAGQTVIFGPPNCGKTTIMLRLCMAVARGDTDYLCWNVSKRCKVAFISAEMPHDELKQYFKDMNPDGTPQLQENFYIFPIGHAFPLTVSDNRNLILKFIDDNDINVAIFDSLSVVAGGSTNDDNIIIALNNFVNKEIRGKRKVACIFIHHNRKQGKEPSAAPITTQQEDLYGSIFIMSNALTVIGMYKKRNDKDIVLTYVKGRYTNDHQVHLVATTDRNYKLKAEEQIEKLVKHGNAEPENSSGSDNEGEGFSSAFSG